MFAFCFSNDLARTGIVTVGICEIQKTMARVLFFIHVHFLVLLLTVAHGLMIPGRSCGLQKSIRRVESRAELKGEDLSTLECVVIPDPRLFNQVYKMVEVARCRANRLSCSSLHCEWALKILCILSKKVLIFTHLCLGKLCLRSSL